jgi:hypothetical protein
MTKKDNTGPWILFTVLAALLLWILSKGRGFLSEAVGATITTIPSEVGTGYPQFDSGVRATVPTGNAVVPLGNVREGATNFPSDPYALSCPIGYEPWKDQQTGAYWCFPQKPFVGVR